MNPYPETLGLEQFSYLRQSAVKVVHLDYYLLDAGPVLLRDALQHAQLAPLDIYFQQVDAGDLIFAHQVGQRPYLTVNRHCRHALIQQISHDVGVHGIVGEFSLEEVAHDALV